MFVHLRTHSYFSFLEGVPSPAELARAAAEAGMPAVGLTDHHGLTGALPFTTACREAGVRPIYGVELAVNDPPASGRLVFLAKDLEGWGSLCRLSTLAQTEPHRDPGRGIPFDSLADHTAGLICLTGGRRGLDSGLPEDRRLALLGRLADLFPGSLYVELHLHDPAARPAVDRLAALARRTGLPVAATNDVHFIRPTDRRLHRLLTAIRTGVRLAAVPESLLAPAGAHFTSVAEMAARFADYPDALEAAAEVADRCRVELPLGVPHYPELDLPPGMTALDLLRERSRRGAVNRYGTLTPDVERRLEHELSVIGPRGYAPLFLIMAEILAYARQEGVPTASRGSAASSLVAHCLGITTPDPLALDLYFERFLNPARESAPDIDTDLCSTRREKVLRFVYERFGGDRVAMVATINTLRGRSALREVAKVHGLSQAEIKPLTEEVPYRGWGPSGDRGEAPYADLAARFPQHRRIFEDAAELLEFPRHLSIHPGGVVIAPGPLTDLVPLHLASKGLVITQFDLEAVSRMGLVKIDLLGTRGLSVLGDVAEKIHGWNRTEFAEPLAVLDAVPEDDAETAALIAAADTIGCFGIESPGMRATLREVRARTPGDLLIALALYRPGPMTGGLKDAFVRRHLGLEKVEQLHPALAPLLADTHGVILYQEQVLRVASVLGGLSLADADLLRRAMSHFDPGDRMRTLRARFVAGAEENSGVPPSVGEQIWELMAAFAGYGFPKAHAASYAQVGWQSAWCKAHYPAEFIAAVLANWGGYYRQRVYINEARRLGLAVKPPHVNHADPEFKTAYPGGGTVLYMGLNQVRGLTRGSIRRILAGRPFRSLDDFLTRVDPRPVEAENLARVGALEGFGTIPVILARLGRGGWQQGQPALFDFPVPGTGADWPLDERVAAQETILGAGLDAHPLDLLDPDRVAGLGAKPVSDESLIVGEPVKVIGIRQSLQRFFHAGETRFLLELEGPLGFVPVLIRSEVYSRIRGAPGNAPLIVSGSVRYDDLWGMPVIAADQVDRYY